MKPMSGNIGTCSSRFQNTTTKLLIRNSTRWSINLVGWNFKPPLEYLTKETDIVEVGYEIANITFIKGNPSFNNVNHYSNEA